MGIFKNYAKNLAVINGSDSATNFSDAAFENGNVICDKSRTTLVLMSPDLFLNLAESGFDSMKMTRCQQLIIDKIQFRDLPLLRFTHDGKGKARVEGHEGRHRCLALKEVGNILIPVRLMSLSTSDGMAIRWGSQCNNQFDALICNDQIMPLEIVNEDGDRVFTMPISITHS